MQLDGLDHVAISVRDVHRSTMWYADVLGLERRHEPELADGSPAMLCIGDTCVALFSLEGRALDQPSSGKGISMRHFAFRARRAEFERARVDLEHRGLSPRFQDHGIAHSIYFANPDGHRLEITTYEV